MDMNERKWSKIAIECLNRGCVCDGCHIQDIMESKCRLKYTVIELVKKWGMPNGNNYNRFSEEDER